MAIITRGTFKGQHSWVLENDALRVTILPDLGAKMASLVYRRTGREMLYQRTDWSVLRLPTYGASFGDFDLSGFDDMFPTIDACRYSGGVWDGTVLPDHGEVWSLPWTANIDADALIASIYGWRLPYRLQKRVTLTGESAVRIDYEATNLSGEDLHVLWAAHPLCACNESTRIVLPAGTTSVVNTFPGSQRFSGYGARASWPEMSAVDGSVSRLNRIGPSSLRRAEKYWIDGPVAAGWAALHHTDTNEVLGFAWPSEQVPYLGVWVTEGGYDGHYHVALEPATAAMDRPDVAARWGRSWVLPANSTAAWYLTLALGESSSVTEVTADGRIVT